MRIAVAMCVLRCIYINIYTHKHTHIHLYIHIYPIYIYTYIFSPAPCGLRSRCACSGAARPRRRGCRPGGSRVPPGRSATPERGKKGQMLKGALCA